MFKKFFNDGSFKIKKYIFKVEPINKTIYDCWLEDLDGYMLTHVRTLKNNETEQFYLLMEQYYGDGWSEIVNIYSSDGRLLHPK